MPADTASDFKSAGQTDWASKADAWRGELARRADEAETARRLPQDIADRLAADGFYAMVNPVGWGGAGATPLEYHDAVEALALGDAAPAWCTFISITAAYGMAFTNSDAVRTLLDAPAMKAAGVFAPMGRAIRTEQEGAPGFRINGRWAWGSGTQNSDWISGGCFLADEAGDLVLDEEGRPQHLSAIFSNDQVHFHDTWTVTGLQGTGSTDFEVKDAFVPEALAVRGFGTARDDEAIFRFPSFGLLAIGIAAVALGTARGAIDDFHDLAVSKVPAGGRNTLAQKSLTHRGVAEAEASVRQGRAFLREAIGEAWTDALEGPVSMERRRDLRLACTSAVQAAKRAIDTIYELAGGSSVYSTSPIQRRFRDVHVATQHIMVGPSTWEVTGRLFLDQPTDISQL